MRRTFALLGAAALAVAGFTGPAGPATADVGIMVPNAQFGEIEPDTSGAGDAGNFELTNTDTVDSYPLINHTVLACVDVNPNPFTFAQYGTGHAIPLGVDASNPGIFVTADSAFVGTAQFKPFQEGDLDSATFKMVLVEDLGGPNESVVDTELQGSPNGTCVAQLPI